MKNNDATGLLENSISLTQKVNTNSDGCCSDGLTKVLSCIRDLRNDIEFLLEANGISASTGKVCRQKLIII